MCFNCWRNIFVVPTLLHTLRSIRNPLNNKNHLGRFEFKSNRCVNFFYYFYDIASLDFIYLTPLFGKTEQFIMNNINPVKLS